jgi:hypothetical protein
MSAVGRLQGVRRGGTETAGTLCRSARYSACHVGRSHGEPHPERARSQPARDREVALAFTRIPPLAGLEGDMLELVPLPARQ